MQHIFQSATRAAFARAGRILASHSRVISLLQAFIAKYNSLGESRHEFRVLLDHWQAFLRLLQSYVTGKYRDVSLSSVLTLLAGVIYFVNPADAIPDLIPVTGLVDDFSVMLWIYKSLQTELEKFLGWERTRMVS